MKLNEMVISHNEPIANLTKGDKILIWCHFKEHHQDFFDVIMDGSTLSLGNYRYLGKIVETLKLEVGQRYQYENSAPVKIIHVCDDMVWYHVEHIPYEVLRQKRSIFITTHRRLSDA